METVNIPDRPDLLPIIPTPANLEKDTVGMQAAAPYCGLGFKKSRLEPALHQLILENFRANAGRFRSEGENMWMGTVEPRNIMAVYFEDHELNREVSRVLQPQHELWSGMRLSESACYGIRVYQRGTYLFNHVDRTESHIISATICIDHSLDEPWPLYIEDVDGNPFQVDMEPGEFIFYEGAKLLHGRPYPLNGNYYAGMFVHYRPAVEGTP